MIDSGDISVVISGPIIHVKNEDGQDINATQCGCRSVKEKLPNAELILSTWIGENTEGIQYDVLVVSHDPGANMNNVNRQICSRTAGIHKASRKYVLAMRSESYIDNLNFLSYFDKYNSFSDEGFRFVDKRIVIPAAVPAHRNNEWFHMGDWYFFGQKEDMIKFWDLPYMNDDEHRTSYEIDDGRVVYNAHRYLMTSFIKKFYPLHFETKADYTEENKTIYERVLAENFVLTGFYKYGLKSYKYPTKGDIKNKIFHLQVDYTWWEWVQLYNKYSEGKEILKVDFFEFISIKLVIPILKLSNKVKNVIIRKFINAKNE